MASSLSDLSVPPGLDDIQGPIEGELDQVIQELRRIIVSDFDVIEEVNQYLLLLHCNHRSILHHLHLGLRYWRHFRHRCHS